MRRAYNNPTGRGTLPLSTPSRGRGAGQFGRGSGAGRDNRAGRGGYSSSQHRGNPSPRGGHITTGVRAARGTSRPYPTSPRYFSSRKLNHLVICLLKASRDQPSRNRNNLSYTDKRTLMKNTINQLRDGPKTVAAPTSSRPVPSNYHTKLVTTDEFYSHVGIAAGVIITNQSLPSVPAPSTFGLKGLEGSCWADQDAPPTTEIPANDQILPQKYDIATSIIDLVESTEATQLLVDFSTPDVAASTEGTQLLIDFNAPDVTASAESMQFLAELSADSSSTTQALMGLMLDDEGIERSLEHSTQYRRVYSITELKDLRSLALTIERSLISNAEMYPKMAQRSRSSSSGPNMFASFVSSLGAEVAAISSPAHNTSQVPNTPTIGPSTSEYEASAEYESISPRGAHHRHLVAESKSSVTPIDPATVEIAAGKEQNDPVFGVLPSDFEPESEKSLESDHIDITGKQATTVVSNDTIKTIKPTEPSGPHAAVVTETEKPFTQSTGRHHPSESLDSDLLTKMKGLKLENTPAKSVSSSNSAIAATQSQRIAPTQPLSDKTNPLLTSLEISNLDLKGAPGLAASKWAKATIDSPSHSGYFPTGTPRNSTPVYTPVYTTVLVVDPITGEQKEVTGILKSGPTSPATVITHAPATPLPLNSPRHESFVLSPPTTGISSFPTRPYVPGRYALDASSSIGGVYNPNAPVFKPTARSLGEVHGHGGSLSDSKSRQALSPTRRENAQL